MFINLFKYKLIQIVRTKEELFWSLAFPLILGTLFFLSFGNYSQKQEVFQTIDIGYILEDADYDQEFDKVVLELSKQDNPILNIVTTDTNKAQELLENKEIAGIVYNTKEIALTVNGEGINESILSSFLQEYIQKKQTIMNVLQTSPEKLDTVLALATGDIQSVKEIQFTKGSMDPMTSYFYALIAMSCLYGCFSGLACAVNIKANLSTLGARRLVAPTNVLKVIIGDFLATILAQFICTMITVVYVIFILKINIGEKMLPLSLTVLVGSIIGVANGLFIGSIGRQSEHVKTAIVLTITMLECFLSGLMMGNMKYIVEQYAPVVNRINPAALIVDAFYSLNIYDTYNRYITNLVSMLIIAGILCIGSFFAIRRERYASI